MKKDDATMQAFIAESLEHLAILEQDLITLEKSGEMGGAELINRLFRAAHSIKGGAGFLGLQNINKLSHKMENILGLIRSHKMKVNAEIVNFLLIATDTLKRMLGKVNESDKQDISSSLAGMDSLLDGLNATPAACKNKKQTDLQVISGQSEEAIQKYRQEGKFFYGFESPSETSIKEMQAYGKLVKTEKAEKLKKKKILFNSILPPADIASLFAEDKENISLITKDGTAISLTDALLLFPEVNKNISSNQIHQDGLNIEKVEESAIVQSSRGKAQIKKEPASLADEPPEKESLSITPVASNSLRVQVDLLDSLMNLSGELVLVRNQLLRSSGSDELKDLGKICQQIDAITSRLQEKVMLTRMQPIGIIFDKFPRVIRDLSLSLGKETGLFIEGSEVHLDKTLIEALNDPLTHLVRNAIDHGIELPAERISKGKDPCGKIFLRAFHAAGQVHIEVADDGQGFDYEKIASVAEAKGNIAKGSAAILSQREKTNLIFLPGFSTALNVTEMSGRGVGLDVVKTNLEKIGGQVDVQTDSGKGTTFHIKIPLTLAIIASQMVSDEREKYAIPQVHIAEFIRIVPEKIKEMIEIVGDAEVIKFRNELLPLIRLSDLLGRERNYVDPRENLLKKERRRAIADRRSRKYPTTAEPEVLAEEVPIPSADLMPRIPIDRRSHPDSSLNVVIISWGSLQYGLLVDAILDSEEIVVKPLGKHLFACKVYMGATIMGDGRVALILDVANLARIAKFSQIEETKRALQLAAEKAARERVKKHSLLLFHMSGNEQFAIPLEQILHIKKIHISDIEDALGKKVIQYRGELLPLINMQPIIMDQTPTTDRFFFVIVLPNKEREIGLLATGPLDTLDVQLVIDEQTFKQDGVRGSLIIAGKATLLLDPQEIIARFCPDNSEQTTKPSAVASKQRTILWVEDSQFFRSQVKKILEAEGYNVIEARDGIDAWNLLEKNSTEIDLVVTDLEMPNLDGIGLAKKIKSKKMFQNLPVIALTTLADEADFGKGKQAGIDEYLLKLDKEQFLACIRKFLAMIPSLAYKKVKKTKKRRNDDD